MATRTMQYWLAQDGALIRYQIVNDLCALYHTHDLRPQKQQFWILSEGMLKEMSCESMNND